MAKKKKQKKSLDRDALRALLAEHDENASVMPLIHKVLTGAKHAGRDLAWLAVYDLDERIRRSAMGLLICVDGNGLASDAFIDEVEAELLKALQAKGVPDERKLVILNLYRHVMDEEPDLDIKSCFNDFETTFGRALDKFIRTLDCSPKCIQRILDGHGLLNTEDALGTLIWDWEELEPLLGVARSLRNYDGDAAAFLLGTVLAHLECELIEAQDVREYFDMLCDIGSPLALWAFDELASRAHGGELAQEAKRCAVDLRLRGVEPAHEFDRSFSHAYTSFVDSDWARSVTVFFNGPDDDLDAITMVWNETEGFISLWPVFGDGRQVDAQLKQAVALSELPFVPCGFEYVRSMLGDAMAVQAKLGKPVPGQLFMLRPYFGPEPIPVQRHVPDLSAYNVDALERSPKLLEGEQVLAQAATYDLSGFTGPEAFRFVRAHMPPKRNQFTKQRLRQFVQEVAVLRRDTFLRCLAMNLEVDALLGRDGEEPAQAAARVYVALSEDVVPFHESDYVLRMCDDATRTVIHNARAGYRSQREANLASMEFESAFAEEFLAGERWLADDDDEGFD